MKKVSFSTATWGIERGGREEWGRGWGRGIVGVERC